MPRLGVMLPRDLTIQNFIPFVRRAEELGFDEIWVVEDCFYRGGIAQAATALAVTERITVGIGILPAAVRNVAFTALEIATLAELHPGRIAAGIGHGVTGWMKQIHEWPASPLTLIDEYFTALGGLLAGDEVTVDGRYVKLDAVALENRLDPIPPIYAGVRGPKSLAIAGRVADGTILAEPVTPEYLEAVREQLDAPDDHTVVAYNFAVVGDDVDAAREVVRGSLLTAGESETRAHVAHSSYHDELVALRESSASAEEFVAAMPDAWIDDLSLTGSAADIRHRIDTLGEVGADSVVLIPVGPDAMAALETFGALVR